MTQKVNSVERPILLMGRELTCTERALPEAEKTLSVLHWGVRKASRYTTHHPKLTLVLRSPELKSLAHDQLCHARLRAKVLDLSAYNVTYVVHDTDWDLDGRLGEILSSDTN